jgi:transcriptional regulator with XRE-family HTH domain
VLEFYSSCNLSGPQRNVSFVPQFCFSDAAQTGETLNQISLLLKKELRRKTTLNPRYSMRSFAKYLGVSPPHLSRVIRGERHFSNTKLKKVIERLNLDPFISDSLLQDSNASKYLNYEQLRLDQIKVISDWYHYAIIAILDLGDFVDDPKWIAKRLNISERLAASALARLIRLGMVKRGLNGKLVDSSDVHRTTLGLADTSASLRNLQKQFLKLSATTVAKVPIEKRSHSGITFSLDSSQLPELKKKIDIFRRQLHRFSERKAKKRDAVYQLAISLYPLTEVE